MYMIQVKEWVMFLLESTLVFCVLDNIRLRWLLRKNLLEQAESAKRALTGMTIVDGLELPAPESEKWMSDGTELRLGVVVIRFGELYVGDRISYQEKTEKVEKYIKEVVRCHRNRLARASVNG